MNAEAYLVSDEDKGVQAEVRTRAPISIFLKHSPLHWVLAMTPILPSFPPSCHHVTKAGKQQ